MHFDNGHSQRYTVLELVADDAPGLLHRVSRVISDHGVDVDLVLISTEGQKAIDVFHITRGGAKLSEDDEAVAESGPRTHVEGERMKLIKAIVRPNMVDNIKEALGKMNIAGMTVTEVRGHGRQKGHTAVYRGREYEVSLLPKMEIEVVVPDGAVDEAIKAIIGAARTGEIGDGRVFVMPVEQGYNIRTGEKDVVDRPVWSDCDGSRALTTPSDLFLSPDLTEEQARAYLQVAGLPRSPRRSTSTCSGWPTTSSCARRSAVSRPICCRRCSNRPIPTPRVAGDGALRGVAQRARDVPRLPARGSARAARADLRDGRLAAR